MYFVSQYSKRVIKSKALDFEVCNAHKCLFTAGFGEILNKMLQPI